VHKSTGKHTLRKENVSYIFHINWKATTIEKILRGIISWLAELMRKLSWLISMSYPGITENNQDKP
jgi:hypothetical protein